MKTRRIAALLLCALFLCCAGCASLTPQTGYLLAMDTVMEYRIWGTSAQAARACAMIGDAERRLSVTDPDSEIAALNRTGAGEVSADTAALLSEALALCARTEGALDVSVYPVLRAWGFTGEEYRVPSEEELAALTETVDYKNVSVDGTYVTLAPGQELDLGSVAKGWVSREIARTLKAEGVKSALFSLGGNIQTIGTKPDGSLWRVAIRDPFGDGYLGVVDTADSAVVTSGGYERYFEEDGELYWHIIDPATGRPAKNGLVSVTVVGADGLLCDALSTGLFVMGLDRAAAFWRESGGFEAVLVTEDGGVYITEGLRGSFAAMDAYEDTEVTVIGRGA